MKIIRIKPQNCNYKAGFHYFRKEGKIRAAGFRFPFTKIEFRFWWGEKKE